MVWIGDSRERRPQGVERQKLKDEEAAIKAEIKILAAKPLPQGDPRQMQRFRNQDLQALAKKVLKIQEKLDGKR